MGLVHDGGVPSFDAFANRINPGCACCSGVHQANAINEIAQRIQFDQTLTHTNRDLACDMVTHFAKFANTTCRGCALGWAIFFIINAIWEFAVLDAVYGVIFLLIGLGLLSCWLGSCGRESVSEKQLRAREQEALEQIKGAG
jgi:hypothetical protein